MARKKLSKEIAFYKFQQFLFTKQWLALKSYANKKGILIVGDIPIYVALDGADTWANPELSSWMRIVRPLQWPAVRRMHFPQQGSFGEILFTVGNTIKETGYAWWMKRISYCYKLYDILRIDHFRGFESYYSIPYGDPTAEFGHWEKGPDYDFFRTLKQELGAKEVIAEDLGYLTPAVLKMVKKTGYPGMKVLQFAFDPREERLSSS